MVVAAAAAIAPRGIARRAIVSGRRVIGRPVTAHLATIGPHADPCRALRSVPAATSLIHESLPFVAFGSFVCLPAAQG